VTYILPRSNWMSSGGNTELTTLLLAKVSSAIRSESSPNLLVSLRVSLLGLIITAKFLSARSSTLALASEHSKLFMLRWAVSWLQVLVEQFVETKTMVT
jgi:hypothetical protein